MLQLEPSKRITTKGAIEHPFFSEYHGKHNFNNSNLPGGKS